MKRTKLLLVILLTSSISMIGFSQDKTESQAIDYKIMSPEDWPAALDAVAAAGKNHKILLENDEVRVLEVTLGPEETGSHHHHHRWPSVTYVLERGHFIDYEVNGNGNIDTIKLPSTQQLPTTMHVGTQAPHYVKNLSETLFELK